MKKEIIVQLEENKLNIKEFLEKYASLSSRKIKRLLKEKKIQINGRNAYFDNDVKTGDKVVIDMSETGRDSVEPEDINIEIVYEDEYFLAVNKPAGMLVHPTLNHPKGTLSNAVKHYFISKGLEAPVRLINRIDMDTSGLVIIAKSGPAHAAFAEQFNQDSCEKIYLAIAEGVIAPKAGIIDKPIGMDEVNPIRRAVRKDGQPSITEYQVLEQFNNAALVKLKLVTGRTHQIRVHLSSLGHPLLGDKLYGGSMKNINRQALHSFELRFIHPYTKKDIILKAEMPQDLIDLINSLREQKNSQQESSK